MDELLKKMDRFLDASKYLQSLQTCALKLAEHFRKVNKSAPDQYSWGKIWFSSCDCITLSQDIDRNLTMEWRAFVEPSKEDIRAFENRYEELSCRFDKYCELLLAGQSLYGEPPVFDE